MKHGLCSRVFTQFHSIPLAVMQISEIFQILFTVHNNVNKHLPSEIVSCYFLKYVLQGFV